MTQQTVNTQPEQQVSDLVDHLVQFDGPPDQFLLHLLAVQCRVGSADGGAILRAGQDKKPEVLAVFPPLADEQTPPPWLAQAVQKLPHALSSTDTVTTPIQMPDQLYGQDPVAYLLLIPLRGGSEGVRGAASFFLQGHEQEFIEQCRQRLELTVSLLSLYEMRLTLQARRADLQRLRSALEVLAAINDLDRYKATAMAFCNELASTFQAERVSVGFLKGRYVRVEGMSHTEKVVRKMELVQAIESAMEECIDQDVEVIHPAPREGTFVSRTTAELATRHGPTTVCSLPLRRAGTSQGVLTVERPQDKPFTIEEVETMRVAGDLCTPRLLELREHDKWMGAKAAGATRNGLAVLVGPRHTWVKATVLGVFAAILFVTLYPAPWRVEAPFEIEAIEHHTIAAPFTARIDKVFVEVGDSVVAGETVLLTMDTAELSAGLQKARSEEKRSQKSAGIAERDGKTAERHIYEQDAAAARADIELLEFNIARSKLQSLVSGKVVEGELKGREGATIQQGDPLLRVEPVDQLRAVLLVPEKRIADVKMAVERRRLEREKVGVADDDPARTDGDLASVAYPGMYFPFVIERISPAAEVVEQRNVFRVWVQLQLHQMDDTPDWLDPGLLGVSKLHIGTASYAWLWTRDLKDWIQMKLWW